MRWTYYTLAWTGLVLTSAGAPAIGNAQQAPPGFLPGAPPGVPGVPYSGAATSGSLSPKLPPPPKGVPRAPGAVAPGQPIDGSTIPGQPIQPIPGETDQPPGFNPGNPEGAPGVAAAPQYPPGLKGDAMRLDDRGYSKEARRFQYAAALADTEDRELWTEQLRWCPGLNRPVFAVQWGLGMTLIAPRQPGQPGADGGLPQAAPAGQGRDQEQQLQQQRMQALQQSGGAIVTTLLEGIALRNTSGMFGAKKNVAAADPQAGPPGQNTPTLNMVGVGEKKVLVDAARKADLDVLVLFEVTISTNKKTMANNTTLQVRLIDVASAIGSGKQLFQSKIVSSSQLAGGQPGANLAPNPGANDPLAQLAESVMAYVDKNLALADFPELTADVVTKRAVALSAKPPENPLPALAELRAYEQKQLLSGDELADHYQKLVGIGDGKTLASGEKFAREKLLARWLPKLPADMVAAGQPGNLAGHGAVGPDGVASTTPGARTGPIEGRALLNERLPNLAFTSLAGQAVDLAQYKGRVVLIDFWSITCPICVKALPSRKDLYAAEQPKGLEIVGISLDTDQAVLEKYILDQKIPWPQFFDGQGSSNLISNKLGIRITGVSLLIDKNGVVRHVNLPSAELARAVAALSAEPAK